MGFAVQGTKMVYTGNVWVYSKDSVKSEVIANKDWSCAFCRNSGKNCVSCKQKEKEIKKSEIQHRRNGEGYATPELRVETEH